MIKKKITIAVQVNGRLRGSFDAQSGIGEKEAIKMAKEVENVSKFIAGSKIKREIYIDGKIVNLVI